MKRWRRAFQAEGTKGRKPAAWRRGPRTRRGLLGAEQCAGARAGPTVGVENTQAQVLALGAKVRSLDFFLSTTEAVYGGWALQPDCVSLSVPICLMEMQDSTCPVKPCGGFQALMQVRCGLLCLVLSKRQGAGRGLGAGGNQLVRAHDEYLFSISTTVGA